MEVVSAGVASGSSGSGVASGVLPEAAGSEPGCGAELSDVAGRFFRLYHSPEPKSTTGPATSQPTRNRAARPSAHFRMRRRSRFLRV